MGGTIKITSEEFDEPAEPRCELRVVFRGPNRIVKEPAFPLQPKETLLIGRKETCHIRLDDGSVSELHAEATLSKDRFGCAATLTDLGSSNGTQVNGKTIKEPQLLEAGDIIRIGNSFLVFREHSFLDNDVVIPTLVGQSPFIRALRTQIRTIAATANITLLQGKSGVGKEVAARAIHDLSGRKGRFLAVNCATIEKELADSTWFGHKKGAFTGAHEDRQGCFEQAAGGTLFLDEIGELDFKVQSKLLRVVEGDYRPLGHQGQPLKTDARLIAATNVDLQRAVDQGKFRDDLYYRLSANTLYIPPLRDRSEDILLLAKSFLLQEKADDVTVTPRLAEALLGYPFPGNVRELQNILKHALQHARQHGTTQLKYAFCEDKFQNRQERSSELSSAKLPSEDSGKLPSEDSGAFVKKKPTKEELLDALNRCEWNLSKVQRQFGWDRHSARRWMDAYDLKRS